MRVCVVGLWHLGCVTAACLAEGGHDVVGLDADPAAITLLRQGKLPLFEPGLADVIAARTAAGRLRFEADARQAGGADVAWVTYDTPVDADDVSDATSVVDQVRALLPHLSDGCLVLVSSQLPVGTTRRLAATASQIGRDQISFG